MGIETLLLVIGLVVVIALGVGLTRAKNKTIDRADPKSGTK